MNTSYNNGKYKQLNIIFENETKKVILIQNKFLKNFVMKIYNTYEDFLKEKNNLSLIQNDYALQLIDDFNEENKFYIIEEYCETNLEELLRTNSEMFNINFIKKIFKQFNNLFYQMINKKIYFDNNLELKNIYIKNKLIKKNFYHIKIKNFIINSNKETEKNNLFKIGCILYELFYKEKFSIEKKNKIYEIENDELLRNLLILLLNNNISLNEYFYHIFFQKEKDKNDPKNLFSYSLILKNIDIYTIFKTSFKEYYLVYSNFSNVFINIYDIIDNKKILTLPEFHTSVISIIKYYYVSNEKKDLLFTASWDNTIKIFDIINKNSFNLINIIKDVGYHKSTNGEWVNIQFLNLIYKENKKYILTYCKDDKNIQIFDFNSTKNLSTFYQCGDKEEIDYVDIYYDIYNDKNYVIFCENGTVYSFDYDTKDVFQTYEKNIVENSFVTFKIQEKEEKIILFCTSFEYLTMFEFFTGKLLKDMFIDKGIIFDVFSFWDEKYIVSIGGFKDKNIYIYNINKKHISKKIEDKNNIKELQDLKQYDHPQYGRVLYIKDNKNNLRMWVCNHEKNNNCLIF